MRTPRERRERARLGEANFVLTTLHNGILAKSNPFAEKDIDNPPKSPFEKGDFRIADPAGAQRKALRSRLACAVANLVRRVRFNKTVGGENSYNPPQPLLYGEIAVTACAPRHSLQATSALGCCSS